MKENDYGYDSGTIIATIQYDPEGQIDSVDAPPRPGTSWEHDEGKRVFRVIDPNGRVTEFHDRAVKFLVVAADQKTGKLEPVLSWGEPKVIYLCREAGL